MITAPNPLASRRDVGTLGLLAFGAALVGGASLALPARALPTKRFRDVTSQTLFRKEIEWLASQGFADGWSDGTFRPLANIKRDAVAAFLYRIAGSPSYRASGRVFRDVSTRTIFAREIEWLYSVGITTGWGDNRFQPLSDIKRDAIAAFIYRMAGSPRFTPTGRRFRDVSKDTLFAKEIEWCASQGIVEGWPDGYFRPLWDCKRDAMAAFLYRAHHKGVLKKPRNPYLTPVSKLTPVSGGVVLKLGWNGTRVRIIQKKLGIHRTGPRQTFDSETRSAVIRFQRRNGLVADGVVGPSTWAKLAPEYPWTMDAWQTSIELPITATPAQRIETFVRFQERQIGTPYTWGGAGWRKAQVAGFDCSGLALQGLYAAGLDPQPINVVKHAEPSYRTSQQLYAHEGLRSFPLSERRRGDLIFFSRTASDPVTHVATYLGNGRMIESWSTDTHTLAYSSRPHNGYYHAKPTIKRPFA